MSDDWFRAVLAKRISDEGLAVEPAAVDKLAAYWELLARWNKTINLTSLPLANSPESTLDKLFMEPLVAAELVSECAIVWFDVGSGGGSPAIPLKIVRPAAKLTMVESKGRKAAFLQEVVRVLQLSNVEVVDQRFETLARQGDTARSADLVSIRAVKLESVLINSCREVLTPDGRMMVFGKEAVRHDSSSGFVPVGQKSLPGSAVVTMFRRT